MTKRLNSIEQTWARKEIISHINNDYSLFKRKIKIFKKLEQIVDSNEYNPLKAEQKFNSLTSDARTKLNRENKESIIEMIGTTIPPSMSLQTNQYLRINFEEWYREDKKLRAQ